MSAPINCIIVEDEPLALERTRNYVQKLPFLNLVGTFDNGIDALVFLQRNQVDLLFLDINMGELSGIQLLEAANLEAEVIITTAYEEFALKGFELNVTDYLLKPFTFDRFLKSAERARNNLISRAADPDTKFIFVKTEYRLEKLLLSELLYIEGMRDYRRIHTTEKRIMTLQTFKDLEEAIPKNVACRVHKSFMVALDKIESIERDRIRIRNILIPVSESYRRQLREMINLKSGKV